MFSIDQDFQISLGCERAVYKIFELRTAQFDLSGHGGTVLVSYVSLSVTDFCVDMCLFPTEIKDEITMIFCGVLLEAFCL